MHLITSLLGWSLAVASTVTALPQAIHLLKTRSFAGVHISTPTIAMVTMLNWCLYTGQIHDIPALFSSIGPLIAWSTSLTLLAILGAPRARTALLGSIALCVLLTTLSITGIIPVGVFGSLSAIGSCTWALPQLIKLLRKPGKDLTGVSSLAYTALGLEDAAWILYAILTKTPAYAVAPIIQLPACLIIAFHARAFHSLKRSKAAHPTANSSFKAPLHAKQSFKLATPQAQPTPSKDETTPLG